MKLNTTLWRKLGAIVRLLGKFPCFELFLNGTRNIQPLKWLACVMHPMYQIHPSINFKISLLLVVL